MQVSQHLIHGTSKLRLPFEGQGRDVIIQSPDASAYLHISLHADPQNGVSESSFLKAGGIIVPIYYGKEKLVWRKYCAAGI
jgi:hypothetical protein